MARPEKPADRNAGPRKPRAVRHALFFETLAATSKVRLACRVSGLDRGSIYKQRARDPAFARQWADALAEGYLHLETEVLEYARGVTGGGKGGAARAFDPALAVTLLKLRKGADPQGRRSHTRLKQPDHEAVMRALDRKLTAMEKAIRKRTEQGR